VRCGLSLTGSEQSPVTGSYEHGNVSSGTLKGWKFDYLNDYQLLKKKSQKNYENYGKW
jgi:hypothetical protein